MLRNRGESGKCPPQADGALLEDDGGHRRKVQERLWSRRPPRGSPLVLLAASAISSPLVLALLSCLNATVSNSGDRGSAAVSRVHSTVMNRESNLSLAILTHLRTVFPPEDMIENQVRGLVGGRDPSAFRDVFVLYDRDSADAGRRARFSERIKILQLRGLVSGYTVLRRNSTVPAAMGSRDGRSKDAAMYAIHQYLTGACQTEYCAFLTYDIMAHGGGGLRHAVRALEEDASLVFAIPPTARLQMSMHMTGNDIKSLAFSIPPEKNVRLTGASCEELVTTKPSSLSTRYVVIARDRFLRSIPFSPTPFKDIWFENHPGVKGFTAGTRCPLGSGYLIHPPPWHRGAHLYKACGDIATLQRMVDRPNYFTVDIHNNMIEKNWTTGCRLASKPPART